MLPATLLTASRQYRHNLDSLSKTAYRLLKEKIVALLPPLKPAMVSGPFKLCVALRRSTRPILASNFKRSTWEAKQWEI